jgi:hypothetical protein
MDWSRLADVPLVRGKELPMSISISNTPATVASDAANSYSNTAAPRQVQPTVNNPADTVRISESQQVYQLYRQGKTVSQIATSLSLPPELVNNYLGISSSKG